MAIFELIKRIHGTSVYFKFALQDYKLLELDNYDEITVKIIAKKKTENTTLRKHIK